jgi:hypothetical protein
MTSPQTELTGDLRQHINETYARGPRRNSCWVMNSEWFTEILHLEAPPSFAPSFTPGIASLPVTLLGIPIEVRDDGGAPHLELAIP